MMNNLVCHLTKCADNTMIASARIAKFISNTLGYPLFDQDIQIEQVLNDFQDLNKFILVNSPTAFCSENMRIAVAELCHRARDPIYANNDYKLRPPSQIRNVNENRYGYILGKTAYYYGLRLWTTIPNWRDTVSVSRTFINWNQLTYVPLETYPEKTEEGIIYWGAFRKGRERYYEYMLGAISYPVTISCPRQAVDHFIELAPQAKYLNKFKQVIPEIAKWPATIMIQDEESHNTEPCVPNRFYEALAAGVAIFIHPAMSYTCEKSGLDGYEEFLVRSPSRVAELLPHAQEIAVKQRMLWHRDYVGELTKQLQTIAAIQYTRPSYEISLEKNKSLLFKNSQV